MCFLRCIYSSWLAAFSLALTVLFFLLTPFTVCHTILDCLSSTESRIFLIWFCMYSVCSFKYTLVNPFCAFLSFYVVILVGFLLFLREAIFTSARFFRTANVSHGTLGLDLCLVGMHSATASKLALTKFSYLSFAVSVSDISCSASNLFLSVYVYISNIPVVKQRPFIVFGCRFSSSIPSQAQSYLCHAIQCAIIPFLINEDVVYLCFSIDCVGVGPKFSLSFLKFSLFSFLKFNLFSRVKSVRCSSFLFDELFKLNWCLCFYLFRHSCLHRWWERCVSGCNKQGRIARFRRRWGPFLHWH